MRRFQMLIFFAIVLFIYSLVNIYLFYKGYNAVPFLKSNRIVYAIIFFLLSAIFIAAKILESRHSSVITDALNILGGFWLAFMLYGFIFFFSEYRGYSGVRIFYFTGSMYFLLLWLCHQFL
jgi:hypothetical protein